MTDFEKGAEEFRAEVSSWLETEGYESAARVVGAWPLPARPLGESREARLESERSDLERRLRVLVGVADDLCFECDGVLATRPPSRNTYNRAFDAIDAEKKLLASDARPSPSSEKQGDMK